jgi:hypothetical protein
MMFFCYFLISSVTAKHALYLLLIVVTNHGPLTGPDIFRIARIGFTYMPTQFRSLLSLLSLTFSIQTKEGEAQKGKQVAELGRRVRKPNTRYPEDVWSS